MTSPATTKPSGLALLRLALNLVDTDEEDLARIVRRAELTEFVLIQGWVDQLYEAAVAYARFRRTIPDAQWERMNQRRAAGIKMDTLMERKRARLEGRVELLLGRERPGPLQGAA